MPHYTDYRCGSCGKQTTKENLVAKQVVFKMVGWGGKGVRSRTIGWICIDDCLKKDPDYNIEAYDAPGLKSPGREAVRQAEELIKNGDATAKPVDPTGAEVQQKPLALLEIRRL